MIQNRRLKGKQMCKTFYTLLIVARIAGLGATTLAADVTSNLVAHWKLDEGSGTAAADSSGNGYHGTLSGGATWTTGKIGGGLSFDGINGTVTIAPATQTGALTVAGWIKCNSTSVSHIVGNSSGGISRFFKVNDNLTTSTWRFVNSAGSQIGFTTASVGTGSWRHGCVTRDGSNNVRVYLDGVESSTGAQALSGNFAPNRFGFGNGFYLNGSLDDVRIYSRALTIEDIRALVIQGGPAASYYYRGQTSVDRDRQQMYAAIGLSEETRGGISP